MCLDKGRSHGLRARALVY